MSAINWVNQGDFFYSDELSDILRTDVQALTKFRQFCDAKDATKKGLHRGNKYRWNRYGDVGSQGRELDERVPMPETNFDVDQAELTITEYGNSVPYTGKLEKLSKHALVEIVEKALKNDCRKAMDIAVYNQFKRTPLRVVPTGGTSTTSITLTENGVSSTSNNVAMGLGHIKALGDIMQERNVPPFKGDDYMIVSHPTTFRPVLTDLEDINKYTDIGIGRIYRGEIGKYEGFRFIQQNQIPKGGAEDSTTFDPYTRTADPWNNGKSSWAFAFGADTVAEAVVVPEIIIARLPTDFGRSKGVAWYALLGFGIVHDGGGPTGGQDTSQCRIFMWSSTT